MGYYWDNKNPQIMLHVTTWINLENVMPRKRSHTQKITLHFMKCPEQVNSERQKADYYLAGAWGRAEGQVAAHVCGFF